MRLSRPAALLACLLLTGTTAAAAQPAAEPLPPNPFAGFQTYQLPNGMKVWYRHAPRAAVSTMALIVPFGRDHDPPGKEQTAHLLEHVLLSDRGGRSEAELARELAIRGGSYSGVTGPHYTLFPLSVESVHAAYGIKWLHAVVAPRTFSDELVTRSRQPVIVEMAGRATPRPPGAAGRLLHHPWLRPPSFWAREFGYPAHEERHADERGSLERVTARDVQTFHDTYYSPAAMALLLVAAAPADDLLPVVEATFGTLPWRPVPPRIDPQRVREVESRRFVHTTSRSTRLTLSYRLAELDGRDVLRLAFLEDLLRLRLTESLRGGTVKSVYDVRTTTEIRGGAAYFAVVIDMYPRDERRVRETVERELVRLRSAAADTAAFYSDRDVLSRSLRIEHASPGALRAWAMRWAARPDLHATFPDPGAYYAAVGADSIAAFARRTFTVERRITSVARPLPVAALLLLLAAGIIAGGAALLYRRIAHVDVDMSTVRFVARLRRPPAVRVASAAAGAAAIIVSARLAGAAAHHAAERWILPHDSFLLVAAAAGLLVFAGTFACMAAVGVLHTKVLVFRDGVRLKSPTYAAHFLPAAVIRGARPAADAKGVRLRRPATRRGQAVMLELQDGSGYLLHVRHPARLIAAIEDLLAGARAADPADAPADAPAADPARAPAADPTDVPAADPAGAPAADPTDPPTVGSVAGPGGRASDSCLA